MVGGFTTSRTVADTGVDFHGSGLEKVIFDLRDITRMLRCQEKVTPCNIKWD